VGLERGTISLVSITEELLEWKSSDSGSRKSRLTGVGIRCADHATLSNLQKLTLTSPTIGGRSVGIVSLRTNATEFYIYIYIYIFFLLFSHWIDSCVGAKAGLAAAGNQAPAV
jgi:hypothetical protein